MKRRRRVDKRANATVCCSRAPVGIWSATIALTLSDGNPCEPRLVPDGHLGPPSVVDFRDKGASGPGTVHLACGRPLTQTMLFVSVDTTGCHLNARDPEIDEQLHECADGTFENLHEFDQLSIPPSADSFQLA